MWLILCGALVMFMHAGFAMLEAGCCRAGFVQSVACRASVYWGSPTICLKTVFTVCGSTIQAQIAEQLTPKSVSVEHEGLVSIRALYAR